MPLLLAIAIGTASADDLQYRHMVLGDGREFDAVILATDDTGFRVRVPQGELNIGFDLLEDMSPGTRADWETQPDWRVLLVAPPARSAGLAAAFKAVPHVQVFTPDEGGAQGLTPAMLGRVESCKLAVDCIADAVRDVPWVWVVAASQEGSNLSFRARTNKGGRFKSPILASMIQADQIAGAAWSALELTPFSPKSPSSAKSADQPKVTKQKRPDDAAVEPRAQREPLDAKQTAALALVPVPGFPSLVRGDASRFGLALASVVPATAAWVGAVGESSQSAHTFIGLSAAGYYAFTVIANQAFGPHDDASPIAEASRRPDPQWQVSVAPTPFGGGMVQIVIVD
jgi:hypothetical protein